MSGTEPVPPKRAMPSWFRYATKGVGTISSPVCIITGLVACFTLTSMCLLAGVLQVLVGCFVFLMEAPCCCSFLDFVDKISIFSDNRAAWQKAVAYAVLATIPISFCAGFSTIFGCGLIFVTAGFYGIQAVGPKASQSDMKTAATTTTEESAGLVKNEAPPPTTQFSGIV